MTSEEADRCGPPSLVMRMPGLRTVRFEMRPIERSPPERTLAFMYGRDGDRLLQSGAMLFQDGGWQTVKGCAKPKLQPSHWVAMVEDAA